nr:MAG: hypothetical protein 3 [Leviviridae sp.]
MRCVGRFLFHVKTRCKMKRPTMLYQAMFRQLNIDLEVSTERDFAYLQSRLEHEGISFLTITLPVLSDSLESGLETGRFALPIGFKPIRRGGTLPAFMQGLFKRVFQLDGKLLDCPCSESIYWIRQISRFYKKPKISCSPQREAEAIIKFKKVEENLNEYKSKVSRQDFVLDSVARILWTSIFHKIDDHRIVCNHGPGVTADRRLSNERHRIRQWYERAEAYFPCADHAFHNYGQAWSGGSDEGVAGIEFIGVSDEPPVRVVFVPKTLTSPRVIAIEPTTMQFMQQGLSRYIVAELESNRLTRNSIRFSDQTVNRLLAYQASKDRKLATIDLSDASDRVHLDLVKRIFKGSPLLDYLEAARSLHADLPDGSNIILTKYASMGSALCFPVEAMVFYTLVLSAIMSSRGLRPSYRNIQRLSRDISVFGDDIIIPSHEVDVVSDYLESYALRVNRRKSFSKSAFRESCGADFFDGVSVLPVYARQLAPARRSEWTPSHIMAWIATADQFYLLGKWHIAQCIRDMVEEVVRRSLPRSTVLTAGLAHFSLIFSTKLRFDKDRCGWKQSRLYFKPLKQKDEIDGDATACFNKVFVHDRSAARHRTYDDSFSKGPSSCTSAAASSVGYQWDMDDRPSHRFPNSDFAGAESGPAGTIDFLRKRGDVGGWTPPAELGSLEFQVGPSQERLRESTERIDFHSTTKRGVFALKRQWVTIIS